MKILQQVPCHKSTWAASDPLKGGKGHSVKETCPFLKVKPIFFSFFLFQGILQSFNKKDPGQRGGEEEE